MTNETILKYYASTEHFRLTNPNPRAATKKGWHWDAPDCCIRALANAVGCDWLTAYDFLSANARRDYTIPNDGVRFRDWLKAGGAVWTNCPAVKGKKRLTALQFAEQHPTGRYIITIANHEIACVDGVMLDTCNFGSSAVVGYLDMSNFKIA